MLHMYIYDTPFLSFKKTHILNFDESDKHVLAKVSD